MLHNGAPSSRRERRHAGLRKARAFYLGRECDAAGKLADDGLILYDSKDLTTHAVCVGMTGSGKTGLCLALLEEAAIDGIPALCIDPKGDLGNLALTFPNLAPSDFQPWVDPAEAQRRGVSVDQLAQQTAEQWKKGLAEWGQAPERIASFKDAAEVTIYTPGSESGLPVSVLRSFAAPPEEQLADTTALRDRIGTLVSGLLSLLGRSADPLKSREHILLANIVEQAWRQGTNLDMVCAHRRRAEAAAGKGRRAGSRNVLSGEGARGAGDGDQQPARLARLLRMAERRAARHAATAVHARRQATHRDPFHCASFRQRAHVHRDAGAE